MIKKAAISAAKKVAIKFAKKHKKLLIVLNLLFFIFMPLFFVLNYLEAAQSILDAITGGTGKGNSGVAQTWDGIGDTDQMYEEEDLAKWNGGKYKNTDYGNSPEDPNQTAKIYQKINEEKSTFSSYLNSEERSQSKDAWARFLSEDHTMFSTDDMQYIFEQVYKYNNRMFEKNIIKYQFEQWSIPEKMDEQGNPTGTYYWQDGVVDTDTDNDPNSENDTIRGRVTRENIEGEKVDGKRRFALNWQDVMAVAMLKASDDSKTWGKQGKTTDYDYRNNSSTPSHVNSTNNYFLTKKGSENDTPGTLDDVIDFFDYDFYYLYDAVKDMDAKTTPYEYDLDSDSLKTGKKIGYRYYSVKDPDNEERHKVLYTNEVDPIPFTQYIPESAPDYITNGWETYYYVYVPTTSIPKDKRKNFGWDETVYPENDKVVCIGRWHVVDPTAFIEGVSRAVTDGKASYYEKRSADEQYVAASGYDWEQRTIDHINMYLKILPFSETSGLSERMEDMLRMYKDKKLLVSYEGTAYDAAMGGGAGMEDKGEALVSQLLDVRIFNYYKNHYLKIGKSDDESKRLAYTEVEKWKENTYTVSSDTSYRIVSKDMDENTLPFYSYGVIYGAPTLRGGDYNEGGDYDFPTFDDNDDLRSTGKFYIANHGEFDQANTDFEYREGANVHFMGRTTDYTREHIKKMLEYIEGKTATKSFVEGITSDASVDAVYNYYKNSGKPDIAAMLAITLTETVTGPTSHGAKHWNYFNLRGTGGGETYYDRKGGAWYDVEKIIKKDNPNATPGDALVYGMQKKIVANFWADGQDTYLLMQFAAYGKVHPTDKEQGEAADKDPGYTWPGYGQHCYCPWWDDTWYSEKVRTGKQDDTLMWCNKNADWYIKILKDSGTYTPMYDMYDKSSYVAMSKAELEEYINRLSNYPWAQALLREASTHLGKKYVWGTEGPDTFDCSGFVWYVTKKCGYTDIGRGDCNHLYDNLTDPISGGLLPGDIFYYHGTQNKSGATHIGIIVDPINKIAIDASSSKGKVIVHKWSDSLIYGYGRIKSRGTQK